MAQGIVILSYLKFYLMSFKKKFDSSWELKCIIRKVNLQKTKLFNIKNVKIKFFKCIILFLYNDNNHKNKKKSIHKCKKKVKYIYLPSRNNHT